MTDKTVDDILYGIAEECGTINYDIFGAKSDLKTLLLERAEKINHPGYCEHCGGAAYIEAIPVSVIEELFT